MYTFTKEDRYTLYRGALAGVLVLVLNAISQYLFEAPAIPFAYGLAVAVALVVIAIQWFNRPHDGPGHGA